MNVKSSEKSKKFVYLVFDSNRKFKIAFENAEDALDCLLLSLEGFPNKEQGESLLRLQYKFHTKHKMFEEFGFEPEEFSGFVVRKVEVH